MAKADNVASNPLKEEMVRIKLIKDSGKYKDDLFVSRNGKNMIIKRGEWVEVPKGIAEIIDNMERQDQVVTDLIQKAEDDANAAKEKLN